MWYMRTNLDIWEQIFLLKTIFYYYLVIYKNILTEFQLYKFFGQNGLLEFQTPGTGWKFYLFIFLF